MVKLVEGISYEFTVEKEIAAEDGVRHFVFAGPDQKKYLVPFSRYEGYKISPGSRIICRVDKINCMGRVFLEPRNPFFVEGEAYQFEVLDHTSVKDRKGRSHNVLTVADPGGNKIDLYPDMHTGLPEIGAKVYLTIKRISKGKIHVG